MEKDFNILELDTVHSTNDWVRENLDGLVDRTAVTANTQTKGRGRFDRTWVSNNSDNIYLSLFLKPSEQFKNITQYTGLVVAKVLEDYGLDAKIKWPNDILIDGKKICGILCESIFLGEKLKGLIVGVGINLNNNNKELQTIDKPATSMFLELNKKIDKKSFLNTLLKEFFLYYDIFIEKGFNFIKNDYESRTDFLKKRISIDGVKGFVQSINDEGELIFIDENQKERRIITGEIEIC